MLLRCWFVFAAVVCGFLVEWLVDGYAPHVLWVVAALGVLLIVTLAPRGLRTTHHRPILHVEHAVAPSAPRPVEQTQNDPALVNELLDTLRPDDLTRLRDQSFTEAWHNRVVHPYRKLLDVGSSLPPLLDAEIGDALDTLLDRTAAFLECYDRDTVADPLISSGEWRIVSDGGAHGDSAAGGMGSLSAQLRARAADVAKAYDRLLAMSGKAEVVPPRRVLESPW